MHLWLLVYIIIAGLLQLAIDEVNSIVVCGTAKDTVSLGIRVSKILKPLRPLQEVFQPNLRGKFILLSQTNWQRRWRYITRTYR